MNFFPRLWQRIFLYSLVLVILSLGMGMLVHDLDVFKDRGNMALVFSEEIAQTLNGESLHVAKSLLSLFNKRHNKLWLEDVDGSLVVGERYQDRSSMELRFHMGKQLHAGLVTLWEITLGQPRYLAEAVLTVENRPLNFYMAFSIPPRPPLRSFLVQWFLSMLFVGGLMSLWIARRVSRPLGRLEKELAELQETNTLKEVTVSGNDEIAAVANAVNLLIVGLRRHITGMRELVANISHELRSPLARMAVSADLIGRALCPQPPAQEENDAEKEHARQEAATALAQKHFALLQEELAYMDNLIGATLLSSKLEFRDTNSFEELDFSSLCEKTARRYTLLFHQADLEFRSDITPGLWVFGDATLLQQLLSNLLDNAVKYSVPADGPVLLRMLKRRGHAFLTVENPYAPFSEDMLERLFEPFFRFEQKTGTGAGLGLWLVRKIVVLHKGEAMAVSTEHGLCLCVQIPLYHKGSSIENGVTH